MPTYGLVSRAGVIPNSFTFDHCGPMAWTVEDCAIVLQALAGYDPRDAGSIEQRRYRITARRSTDDVRGLRIGVLRHYWEEDLPAHEDLRRAMDEAIEVFGKLGAKVEDVPRAPDEGLAWTSRSSSPRPRSSPSTTTTSSSRPGDFGRDFLGRILPACLFQAADYVAASREHRRIIAEARALYGKYDVLLTAGFGPAPRLDAHRTVELLAAPERLHAVERHRRPRAGALQRLQQDRAAARHADHRPAVRRGDRAQGRPRLRAGDGVARPPAAARRRARRSPPVTPKGNEPDASGGRTPQTRGLALDLAARAGLKLNERQQAILLECAPYALAMANRIRKDRGRFEEPALIFRFPA